MHAGFANLVVQQRHAHGGSSCVLTLAFHFHLAEFFELKKFAGLSLEETGCSLLAFFSLPSVCPFFTPRERGSS